MQPNWRLLAKLIAVRVISALALLVLAALPIYAQEVAGQTLDQSFAESSIADVSDNAVNPYPFSERFRDLYRSPYQASTLVVVSAGAGWGQMRNGPPGWPQGMEGYGIRFASGYGRFLAGKTIGFGVAALDHEDPRYVPSDYPQRAIFRRVRYAFASTFVSKRNEGHIFAFSRVAGIYGSAFAANTWYPPTSNDPWHGARMGTTGLATNFGLNLLREFLPFGRHF
jgi:hypothetical protein